jgi:transposase
MSSPGRWKSFSGAGVWRPRAQFRPPGRRFPATGAGAELATERQSERLPLQRLTEIAAVGAVSPRQIEARITMALAALHPLLV